MDMKEVIYSDIYANSEEYYDQIALRLYNEKKIRVEFRDVKDNVKFIGETILAVNSKPENTLIIAERPISEFVIPSEFKDFVLPNAVRYDVGDRRLDDILVRPDIADVVSIDYNKYINAITFIRGLQKKGWNEDLLTLDSLRKDVTFEEIRSRMAVKCLINKKWVVKVNYDGVPFIPVGIKYGFGFFGESYFNADDEKVCKDYLINF
jgi:hypothetical protein